VRACQTGPYNPLVHRFFAPTLDPGDGTLVLPKEESEHLRRVLRLGVGDRVAVFDGRGYECLAEVAGFLRRDAQLRLLGRLDPVPEPTVDITLVQAVLKGDKMDAIVRDAVMLGTVAFQPIVAARTETTVAALLRGARLERWQRVALASVKQCGRAVLPEVRLPLTLTTYLDERPPALRIMLTEPGAGRRTVPLRTVLQEPAPRDVAVMVGPEGGWASAEIDAAECQGIRLVSLGPRTLRADAVPVAVLSALQCVWDVSEPRRADLSS
jgi:16S rRNA (uracil1498-N3)-methyltransferase